MGRGGGAKSNDKMIKGTKFSSLGVNLLLPLLIIMMLFVTLLWLVLPLAPPLAPKATGPSGGSNGGSTKLPPTEDLRFRPSLTPVATRLFTKSEAISFNYILKVFILDIFLSLSETLFSLHCKAVCDFQFPK